MILDASERIGDPWRKRWDSLRLYSPAAYDGLPGMRFPARRASFPTTHEMADYLEAYAGHFELPVRSGTAVDALSKEDERYVAHRRRQTFEADNVVVATGVMQKPFVPSFAPELDPRIRSSTRATTATSRSSRRAACSSSARATPEPTSPTRRRPSTRPSSRGRTPVRSRHRSRRGADASASACCSSSARTSSPWTRRSAARCARTSGTAALRSCATGRKDLLAAGVERVLARTVGVQDGLPVLDDGRVLDVQNVIWCTGFRRDFSWIEVPFEVDEDGYPGAVPRRRRLRSRPLLRGAALPALVHVDAHRRDRAGTPSGSRSTLRLGRQEARESATAAAIREQVAS